MLTTEAGQERWKSHPMDALPAELAAIQRSTTFARPPDGSEVRRIVGLDAIRMGGGNGVATWKAPSLNYHTVLEERVTGERLVTERIIMEPVDPRRFLPPAGAEVEESSVKAGRVVMSYQDYLAQRQPGGGR